MAPLVTTIEAGTGFWGDVTASMDWCEENYEWTPYIAEFFNSWSSIAMVILGEACARMNPTGNPAFTLLGRSITVVGIGSWLFHATLKYSMQMTDELPMLWSMSIACYICVTTQYSVNKQFIRNVLTLWTLFVTLLTAGFSGKVQFFMFQSSFNFLSLVVAFMCWRGKRELEYANMSHVGDLFSSGIKLYLAAGAVWLTDTNLCQYINGRDSTSILPFNLQLHAWWHVLASLGLVHLVVLLMGHYCLAKDIPFKLKYVYGIFPRICAE